MIAHNKISMLVNGMIRVIEINVKRIAKDGYRFFKRNPMLVKNTLSFFLVPLAIHVFSIAPHSMRMDKATSVEFDILEHFACSGV